MENYSTLFTIARTALQHNEKRDQLSLKGIKKRKGGLGARKRRDAARAKARLNLDLTNTLPPLMRMKTNMRSSNNKTKSKRNKNRSDIAPLSQERKACQRGENKERGYRNASNIVEEPNHSDENATDLCRDSCNRSKICYQTGRNARNRNGDSYGRDRQENIYGGNARSRDGNASSRGGNASSRGGNASSRGENVSNRGGNASGRGGNACARVKNYYQRRANAYYRHRKVYYRGETASKRPLREGRLSESDPNVNFKIRKPVEHIHAQGSLSETLEKSLIDYSVASKELVRANHLAFSNATINPTSNQERAEKNSGNATGVFKKDMYTARSTDISLNHCRHQISNGQTKMWCSSSIAHLPFTGNATGAILKHKMYAEKRFEPSLHSRYRSLHVDHELRSSRDAIERDAGFAFGGEIRRSARLSNEISEKTLQLKMLSGNNTLYATPCAARHLSFRERLGYALPSPLFDRASTEPEMLRERASHLHSVSGATMSEATQKKRSSAARCAAQAAILRMSKNCDDN